MSREQVTAYVKPEVMLALRKWRNPGVSDSSAIEQALEMFLRDRSYLPGYSRLADLEARVKELEDRARGDAAGR